MENTIAGIKKDLSRVTRQRVEPTIGQDVVGQKISPRIELKTKGFTEEPVFERPVVAQEIDPVMERQVVGRERLPVKFFVLDDQAYHYMQELQQPAYLRTTATILARLDYRSLAMGYGVAYQEIRTNDELEPRIRSVLEHPGPVLTRVVVDYRRRPVRWIAAARGQFLGGLTPEQRRRFLARVASRAVERPQND